MTSVLSPEYPSEKLIDTLGETLTPKELENCSQEMSIVEPTITKQFWESTETNPGLYIILSGKVRLLDSADNLITTLSSGSLFGEASLFPEENFIAYAARASANLKLGYLKAETLQKLINKHPDIKKRLLANAQLWDLLLLSRQNSQFPPHTSQVEGTLKALSLFERYELKQGYLNSQISQDGQLWLLHTGELRNSQNQTLTPGNISTAPKQGNWQVTQPSVAYILCSENWQTALEHCPELGNWGAGTTDKEPQKREKKAQSTTAKIIPFPQAPATSTAQPKKSLPYFPSPKVRIQHWWRRINKSYPFYAQQSGADCGATCLVMIGKYWNKHLSVNRLRDLTNVNRSGASLKALATAAESLGFSSRPVKASLDKLAQQPLPAIAHWEGNHFIVVYEITKKRVIVCDPGIGQRSLTRSEFSARWTGYALLLEPTALLKSTKDEKTSLWKFFELIKPHYRVLVEVFLASVLIQMFGLVTPVFTQLLLDRVLVQRSIPTLNAVGVGMIVFGLFSIAMNGVRQYLLAHTANRISISLLVGFIKHTFRLPLSYFESRFVGDIVSRIQETQKIQSFLTGQTLGIILDLLTLGNPKK